MYESLFWLIPSSRVREWFMCFPFCFVFKHSQLRTFSKMNDSPLHKYTITLSTLIKKIKKNQLSKTYWHQQHCQFQRVSGELVPSTFHACCLNTTGEPLMLFITKLIIKCIKACICSPTAAWELEDRRQKKKRKQNTPSLTIYLYYWIWTDFLIKKKPYLWCSMVWVSNFALNRHCSDLKGRVPARQGSYIHQLSCW